MIDYSTFLQLLSHHANVPENWIETLKTQIETALQPQKNKDILIWEEVLNQLPQAHPSEIVLNENTIRIGTENDLKQNEKNNLMVQLRRLHPWRKGPISFFGVFIDTEWRSDMKWNRLKDHIDVLNDRLVLDVGSGNGYFCWRMRGAGARLVMGLDPYLKYVYQFAAMQKYIADSAVQVLPLGIDDLPSNLQCFDTVFSMGVFYHRRSPFDHLFKLKSLLRPGGQLVLETLIVEGEKGYVLVPEGRYAKMRNVWFIPSPLTLESWLKRAAFSDIHLVDVSLTTTQEQRKTSWMEFESLPDFLHPENNHLTIEGYPRPRRAIFLARRP